MSEETKDTPTVAALLAGIAEAVCDELCKYPAMYNVEDDEALDALDDMYNDICNRCPLNLLR